MSRFFIAFFFPILLLGQAEPDSFKKTLSQAGLKYKVVFTYDDALLSNFMALDRQLPNRLEDFLSILSKEYFLDPSQMQTSILLAPNKKTEKKTLCGYVKSDLFVHEIENTWVILGNQFALSDSSGYFSFQNINPEENKIKFKHLKFGTVELPITLSEKCEKYFIDHSEIKLGEVIVNFIAPPIEKSSNGVFSINLKDFDTSPGSINPDIFELLQLIPGISTPNEDNSIFVRGGTPDQNNVMWNSVRMYQNNHANGSLFSLNPYGIENVKLLLKGVPSNYGEHTSGLILLDNYQKPSAPFFKGSFGIGLLDTDLVTSFNIKEKVQINLSLRSSLNFVLSDNFKLNTFNRLVESSTSNNTLINQNNYYNDYTFSSRYKINKNAVIDLHSFYMRDMIDYGLREDDLEYQDALRSRNFGLGTRFNLQSGFWRHVFNFSYSDFEMRYNRQSYEFEYDEEDGEYETEYENTTRRGNHIQEGFFKTQHSKVWGKKNHILIGLDVIHRTVLLNNQTKENDEESTLSENIIGFNGAIYSTLKLYLTQKNHIELGLRYNYFPSIAASRIEPRINFSQFLNPQWMLNATYEKKSQTIYRTNETIQNTSDRTYNLWTQANDQLYPLLESTQVSFGTVRKGSTSIFELDFYKKIIDGITTFNFGYLDPNDQDFHLGISQILGMDLFFQKRWNALNLWFSYGYQDNTNRFEGLKKGVWFNSNFMVKHQSKLGLNYTINQWSFSANYNIRSGVPYSIPAGYEQVGSNYRLTYDTLNSVFLPSFDRMDFSISKGFELKRSNRLELKLAVKNVTRQQNVLERIYFFDRKKMEIRKLDRYSMVPNINFGLRFYHQ